MLTHEKRTPQRWSPLHSGRTTQNYYASRSAPPAEAYSSYWQAKPDPDGQIRDRRGDRDRFLADLADELAWLERLQSRSDGRARVLDVGHGLGWLLSVLSDKWEKHGVEVCEDAHRYAKAEYGIASFHGTLQEARYPDELFDVVACHHVIEHVEDPIDLMHSIRRVLRRGGKLLLATPDFGSPCAKRFGDKYRMLHDRTHVSLFTLESTTRMLTELGFKIDDVRFPFPDRYATAETMERWLDTSKVSPPWPGNWMTFYCSK